MFVFGCFHLAASSVTKKIEHLKETTTGLKRIKYFATPTKLSFGGSQIYRTRT